MIDHMLIKALMTDIYIMYTSTYVPYCSIVHKMSSFPPASIETGSIVPETIGDTAIVADMWPPVADVPAIVAAIKSPVTGCPQQAYRWRHDPYAGYPIISAITPGPITGSPQISITGTWRLHIIRQCRRCLLRLYRNSRCIISIISIVLAMASSGCKDADTK
jgi:hypothetical protein